MGKMNTISLRLSELEAMLYDNGLHYEPFIQECKLLCELGFAGEVQDIIWDFEYFIATNEGD
jgi:hypothetical protein